MGLLSLFKLFFKSAIVLVLAAFVLLFYPNLGPYNVSYTAYDLPSTKKLEGTLALNTKLDNAERLFENLIKGPESLVYDNGVLYTGVHGGLVVKIINQQLIPFVKFGKSCDGIHEEEICGRPLGMHLDSKSKKLFVCDGYYGLFEVNTTTGESNRLIGPDDWIEGRKPKLFNSVTVSSDGMVYWTDSDSNFDLKNLVYSSLTDGTGRLIKYDPTTKRNIVLIDKISFANGVILADDESYILVAETFKYRILRFYLKGAKKGTYDVFADGLPGTPDNFKRHPSTGNIFAGLVIARDNEKTPAMVRDIGKYPLLRKFVTRVLHLLQTSFSFANELFPHTIFKKMIHSIAHCETFMSLVPQIQRVTIIELDRNGKIVNSLHSTDGRIFGISEIEFIDNYAYLASPFNPYLARVPLK